MAEAIINREQLLQLLDDFFMVTGIRITYWLPNGKKFISCDEKNRESEFCNQLKACSELCRRCDQCDSSAISKARAERKTVMYTCHAGILECVHPVIQNDKLLGFLMIGQTRDNGNDETERKQRMEAYGEYGIDVSKLYASYLTLPVINRDQMLAAARLLKAIACYTYLNGYVRYATPSVAVRLDEYIKKHLSEKITLDDLEKALYISKSKLCHTLRAELGLTVVDFINARRIANVKKMLANGHKFSEAAYASGFSDPSYCSKVFKKTEGFSAKEYIANLEKRE